MVPLWFPYGSPMVPLWFPYGFPTVSLRFPYGFPTVSLWFPYGFPMVSLWFPYGFPLEPLWTSEKVGQNRTTRTKSDKVEKCFFGGPAAGFRRYWWFRRVVIIISPVRAGGRGRETGRNIFASNNNKSCFFTLRIKTSCSRSRRQTRYVTFHRAKCMHTGWREETPRRLGARLRTSTVWRTRRIGKTWRRFQKIAIFRMLGAAIWIQIFTFSRPQTSVQFLKAHFLCGPPQPFAGSFSTH